jgi:general secretion pathway protein J
MGVRSDAGFTLVELMIAVALMGMLTMLAYGAVQFGNLSWHHIDSSRDADAERTAIRQLLLHAITGAYPGFSSAEYNDRSIAFSGEKEALQLVAPLPEALSPGVMAVEQFSMGRQGDRSSLLMSWHLDLPAATGGTLPSQVVRIASSISAIRFGYFGRVKEGNPPAWFDRWSGLDHLPELVRVQVWRADGGKTPWLDFSAETQTTANVACVYDPQTPICRRLE